MDKSIWLFPYDWMEEGCGDWKKEIYRFWWMSLEFRSIRKLVRDDLGYVQVCDSQGAYLASGEDVFNEKLEVDQSLKMTPQQYHEVLKSFIQFRRGLISLGLLNDELVRVQVFVPEASF